MFSCFFFTEIRKSTADVDERIMHHPELQEIRDNTTCQLFHPSVQTARICAKKSKGDQEQGRLSGSRPRSQCFWGGWGGGLDKDKDNNKDNDRQ